MKKRLVLKSFFVGLGILSACNAKDKPAEETANTQEIDISAAPKWSQEAIWYQIFVERFNNGDTTNDPKAENLAQPFLKNFAPENWAITPWTQAWETEDAWMKKTGESWQHNLQYRRYGGDLQGVINKLDYLSDLGITAIYFNPLNHAPSLHKYDAASYHHIDAHFGPDPAGDLEIMAKENPGDPSTWKWTSADLLFLDLVAKCKAKGIKVIVDYSWNHTGTNFFAWQDIVKNQEKSAYKDWYEVTAFDNPNTPENEFKYDGWLNISSLPELKKVNRSSEKRPGLPFDGNVQAKVKEHIFSCSARWLVPDGDTSRGIDGFRLDVADHVPLGFWRDYRKFVRNIQPEAYLVGEIWWETWPETHMDPQPYVEGDVFDAVMFYQIYRPAKYFFSKSDFNIDAKQLVDSLKLHWSKLGKDKQAAMMNLSASHDAPRLLTCFANHGKYKFQANKGDNPGYNIGNPNEETYQRVRLYLAHLFTIPGSPHIWNGDEMGMWGADDPHCRKPLTWQEYNFSPETHNKKEHRVGFNQDHFNYYQQLIKIRKNNPELVSGDIEFLEAKGKFLIYKRKLEKSEIMVIINAGNTQESYQLPAGTYLNLLTNQTLNGGEIELASLSSLLLKKQ